MQTRSYTSGFTLIEVLIVIAILAILASIAIVAMNPGRHLADARNTQRQAHVASILNAISNRLLDTHGAFSYENSDCIDIPTTATRIASDGYNLRNCLVPTYMGEIPHDARIGGVNTCKGADTCPSYNAGYTIRKHPGAFRITVCAPGATEQEQEICMSA